MDETECTASNFMPKDLIEIICILERDEKCHSYKIIRKRKYFTLVTKFPAKNGESTPLKNYASGRQTASHQDKKEVSSEEKPPNRKPKRKKNKSSALPSGPKSAKQHSVQDSSNVKAGQPKLKKKPPAVVARDRARRKEYWKRMKVPRQLRAENLALFYKLQELQTVASPQIPVVRQPEKSGCLERTSAVPQSHKLQESQTVASPQIPVVRQPEKSGSLERTSCVSQSSQLQDTETVASPQIPVVRQPEKSGSLERTSSVSQSFSYLTIEREPGGTAQVHSDLNKLSAEAAAEHSSSFSEDCEVSDIVCAHCLKKGRQTELRRCTGCKSFSYCNKVCQISDWPSHKQLCKSIQSLNSKN